MGWAIISKIFKKMMPSLISADYFCGSILVNNFQIPVIKLSELPMLGHRLHMIIVDPSIYNRLMTTRVPIRILMIEAANLSQTRENIRHLREIPAPIL